jgi:hypothetical protein
LFVTPAGPAFHWPRLVPGYIEAFTDWIVATTNAK